VIDDHHTHRAGRQRHEVIAVPHIRAGTLRKSQVYLMNERSWAQRFASAAAEMATRQNAELVIDETKEVINGTLVTLPPACKRPIDISILGAHVALSADYAGSEPMTGIRSGNGQRVGRRHAAGLQQEGADLQRQTRIGAVVASPGRGG
jgi:hypothetical protein